MKTLLASILALFVALPSAMSQAEEKDVSSEAFGKLALGQKAGTLTKQLGEPEAKGKDTLWGATGEWVQEWKYPAKGLTFNMASEAKGGAKSVLMITATGKCSLATARGIKIGSTEAEVRKAYADVESKEDGSPGEVFVAGSVYGGVIFNFTKGKVSKIFIGAAAE